MRNRIMAAIFSALAAVTVVATTTSSAKADYCRMINVNGHMTYYCNK